VRKAAPEGGESVEIDEALMQYLEELSCLTLAQEEKQRIAEDLKKILVYMERLGELDTQGVPERSHPFDHVNVFRKDVAAASFDRERILANAPDRDERMFIAPKTVE
jgi:aspartyl-tRNA(Asn)/glutamyl-tRNA(Gln) amidotransferase subunit C